MSASNSHHNSAKSGPIHHNSVKAGQIHFNSVIEEQIHHNSGRSRKSPNSARTGQIHHSVKASQSHNFARTGQIHHSVKASQSYNFARKGEMHYNSLCSGWIRANSVSTGGIHTNSARAGEVHHNYLKAREIHQNSTRTGQNHHNYGMTGEVPFSFSRPGQIYHSDPLRAEQVDQSTRAKVIHNNSLRARQRKYLCETCDKQFDFPESLKKLRYASKVTNPKKLKACEFCTKILISEGVAILDDELDTCEVCGIRFSMKKFMKKHCLSFSEGDENKPIVCNDCMIKISMEENLRIHCLTLDCQERIFYVCEVCKLKCCTEEKLKVHRRAHEREWENLWKSKEKIVDSYQKNEENDCEMHFGVDVFREIMGSQSSISEQNENSYKSEVENLQFYKSEETGKFSESRGKSSQYYKSEQVGNSYKSGMRNRQFYKSEQTRNSYESGRNSSQFHNSEEKENLFECEFCKKKFYLMKDLNIHYLSHEKTKRLCQMCEKDLSGEYMSGERLLCVSCEESLTLKQMMKQHCLSHKNKEVERTLSKQILKIHSLSVASRNSFICGVCQKGFPSRKDLHSHYPVHSTTEVHYCAGCNKDVVLNSTMKLSTCPKRREIFV